MEAAAPAEHRGGLRQLLQEEKQPGHETEARMMYEFSLGIPEVDRIVC